jgi:ribonuclease P protein component
MTSRSFIAERRVGSVGSRRQLESLVVAPFAGPYRGGLTSSDPPLRDRLSAVPSFARISEDHNEAAVSAQRAQAFQEAWFPFAHEHPWRTCGDPLSSPERPSSAVGVIDRLRGRAAFIRLRAEGARHGSGPIRLVSRLDPTQNAHIAFAIPRSVGNAVERNRVRRRIRGVLHEEARANPSFPVGGDYLIRITGRIDDWSSARLRSTMCDLLTPPAEAR